MQKPAGGELQALARGHLLMHFTEMAEYAAQPVPIFVKGDGCHVVDDAGNRYIDGLSGLFCLNLGHAYGGEIGRVAQRQMETLPYAPCWSGAHPPAIELAARIAALAPDGMDRVFFVSGGSEAVESAWKMALQYHQACGEPQRRKAIARVNSYHGATMGALSFTGMDVPRRAFAPFPIAVTHVSETNPYRHPDGHDPERFCRTLLDEIEAVIEAEGPDTIAMLIAEPVQSAGGSLIPPPGYWQGLREICDRHGILLCSDEVICAFGRLGAWFGARRLDYTPDLITFAKGITGAHFPLGGVVIHDRVAAPFLEGRVNYLHGYTFGGHPVGAAVALAALDVYERERIIENVQANEPYAQAALESLRDIPIVGDVRGMGYFWSVELVKDQETKERMEGPQATHVLRSILNPEVWKRGLLCRLDSRSDPIVQIAPPLVAGPELFDDIVAILRESLEVLAERLNEPAPAHAHFAPDAL